MAVFLWFVLRTWIVIPCKPFFYVCLKFAWWTQAEFVYCSLLSLCCNMQTSTQRLELMAWRQNLNHSDPDERSHFHRHGKCNTLHLKAYVSKSGVVCFFYMTLSVFSLFYHFSVITTVILLLNTQKSRERAEDGKSCVV